MKLTEEQAEDAIDRVESVLGMAHGGWDMVDRMSVFRAIEAEVLRGITGDGRGEAKPVAWAWGRRDANGEVYDCISDAEHSLNEGKYTVLLYTSPPQQEQAAPVQDGWMPIETAPKDGTPHIRGLHVHNNLGDFIYWDCHAGRINDETGQFEDLGGEHTGWDADDYSHWMPLPAAPKPQIWLL